MTQKAPFVVGLTGGIGSGKTAVAELFACRGVVIVDTDQIAHGLTEPHGRAMAAIREAFGDGIVSPDGALNRPAMRTLAFADPAARKRLEAILHPMIRDESDHLCRAAVAPYVILAVPLLIESGTYRERVQRLCVVDCPEEVQVQRVMQRSGLDAAQVRAIMAAQATRAARLAAADDVVDNGAAREALAPQVEALHQRYLALASLWGGV
ncbi:dephospho-CoA kinase [Zoogloea sp.]|uniref:dephospho-CoA kinase n=1 Tax=Zoogloea sp. TaxID=49181 RepID=UPI0026262A70|nr:dephospho-CoA kinase [Zoogloea sp.]MDD3353711.1 dephospho-CoA kinase [Zoogloea sp.]